jgi:amidohydrolase
VVRVTTETLRAQITDYIDRHAGMLLDVSHSIHANPELGFEEHHAHDVLTSALSDAGLDTERGAFDVPTAFRATAGSGDGPLIAVLLEYDALPEIGHACGHNIIASAGLGAGLAAAAVAEATGGRLTILGTPAEEGGGGKIVMAERGAFDGVEAAMMIHPADADLIAMNTVALQKLIATYEGLAAHAAAAPWMGRNALDAAVLGYNNVAALRQHIGTDERVHGIFTHGGDKANIVPHRAEAMWYVRSPTVESLQPLKQRVQTCLEAGASAAGCGCQIEWKTGAEAYSDMRDNAAVLGSFVANASLVGRTLRDPRMGQKVVGSTDMGNISYLVPSIHPMLQVAPAGVPIHSHKFAAYAGGEEGDRAVLDGAKAMALTVLDLWTNATLVQAAKTEFAAG